MGIHLLLEFGFILSMQIGFGYNSNVFEQAGFSMRTLLLGIIIEVLIIVVY